MTRVVALIPDLLFGSKVVGLFGTAEYEVVLCGSQVDAVKTVGVGDVLIVDLTDSEVNCRELIEEINLGGRRPKLILGVYAHVYPDQKRLALEAGFDFVVPRSRMIREGVGLIERLLV